MPGYERVMGSVGAKLASKLVTNGSPHGFSAVPVRGGTCPNGPAKIADAGRVSRSTREFVIPLGGHGITHLYDYFMVRPVTHVGQGDNAGSPSSCVEPPVRV